MMLAIFIFLLIVLVLDLNIYVYVSCFKDSIKVYYSIGNYFHLLPLRKIISNKNFNNKNLKKNKRLILNIISHSIIDRVYFAKFSIKKLFMDPITNTSFFIFGNQLRGLLLRHSKLVNNSDIRLQHDKYYENLDYYIEAHINIISIIWASIKTILKR